MVSFHRKRQSLAAITPPPMIVRIQDGPEILSSGDELRFTLWLGPFPIRWHAVIESVSDSGFADRQIAGPFAHWVHRHTFLDSGKGITTVRDEIEYVYRRHLVWGPVGRLFVLWPAAALCLPRVENKAAAGHRATIGWKIDRSLGAFGLRSASREDRPTKC